MDAKQRGIFIGLAAFSLLIFMIGGIATGGISARPMEVKLLNDGRESRPEFDAGFLYDSALEAYDRMDWVNARALANRLSYVRPKFAAAYKLLAAISLRERNYRYARDECRKAMALDPTDMTTRLSLAAALRGLNQPKEAARLYRSVIADEHSLDGHRQEAEVHLREMGEEADATAENGPTP